MPTKRQLIEKGAKFMLYSLPLMFIGPSVIYNAFINKQNIWHYLVLAIGIFICLSAVYLLFKGIKTITDALFQS
ncbi:DUF6095 family protein [Flavobacterium sp. j3]|uniref:DUF6095 family protein n=1 Tax=Flavobacterium aureirubrum TaxID=3133147 RepID=A0ABU9N4X5_9FLAO